MALRLYSINETCAGRLFQRVRQGPIFRAVGSADRSDPAKMILRLLAVALLDLPQTVIIPGQHMVRIRFQCPLVPDLRELVVAELSRSGWPRSGDRRGRAPEAARSRRHSRGDHRSSNRPRDTPEQKRDRRCWSAYWPFWPVGYGWLWCPKQKEAIHRLHRRHRLLLPPQRPE